MRIRETKSLREKLEKEKKKKESQNKYGKKAKIRWKKCNYDKSKLTKMIPAVVAKT